MSDSGTQKPPGPTTPDEPDPADPEWANDALRQFHAGAESRIDIEEANRRFGALLARAMKEGYPSDPALEGRPREVTSLGIQTIVSLNFIATHDGPMWSVGVHGYSQEGSLCHFLDESDAQGAVSRLIEVADAQGVFQEHWARGVAETLQLRSDSRLTPDGVARRKSLAFQGWRSGAFRERAGGPLRSLAVGAHEDILLRAIPTPEGTMWRLNLACATAGDSHFIDFYYAERADAYKAMSALIEAGEIAGLIPRMPRIVYHRWTRVTHDQAHEILGPDGDWSYRGLLADGTPVIVSEARGVAVSLLMPSLTPYYTVLREVEGKGFQARLVKV